MSSSHPTIAFVTPQDAADPNAWSGVPYHMLRALRGAGATVHAVDKLRPARRLLTRALTRAYKLRGQTYRADREPAVLRAYAQQVSAALRDLPHDFILSTGTRPVAYLRAGRPVVLWTDATFGAMVDYYPEFSRLAGRTLRDGQRAEQAALDACRLAIFSSDWAARSAIEQYGIDPARVAVVPYGANIDWNPPPERVPAIVAGRDRQVLRLLFVGVDWARKGGDVAVAVTAELIRRGQPAELHVVGGQPPIQVRNRVSSGKTGFYFHDFVSKRDAAGRAQLDRLYRDCHFLILPSRADCSPVVIAEAGAYGLPSVATAVGGIPTAIREDENGRTFPLDAGPEAYADYLLACFAPAERYEALAATTLAHYRARLNWAAAAEAALTLIRQHVL